MNLLSDLPMPQALALVTGFIEKYKAGDVDSVAFHKLATELLRDGRLGLITPVVNEFPIPEFEKDQNPEANLMAARLDAIRATMPGVYGPIHATSYRMQQTIKQVEDHKEIESPLVDYRKELTDALDRYPIWRSFVIHPETTIRLAALTRLGTVHNPIKEAAIVFALGDGNAIIRQRARSLLGEAPPIRHRSHYSAKDVRNRGTIQQAIKQIVELNTDDELRGFLDDPRTNVRYAAALKLKPESAFWEMLATDASARVRRVVAEKVPMHMKEIVSFLLQDPQQSVRTIIGKRKLAEPIELPVNERNQRKQEWENQLNEQ